MLFKLDFASASELAGLSPHLFLCIPGCCVKFFIPTLGAKPGFDFLLPLSLSLITQDRLCLAVEEELV